MTIRSKWQIRFYFLAIPLLIGGCAVPKSEKSIDWREVRHEVLKKSATSPNKDYSELVDWVIKDVRQKLENPKYSSENQLPRQDYEQLVDWVIQEVQQKMQKNGSVLDPNDPMPDEIRRLQGQAQP